MSVGREKDSEAAVVPQEVVKQDVVVGAHERPQVEMWSESGHAAVVGAGTRHRKCSDAERATPRRSGCSERGTRQYSVGAVLAKPSLAGGKRGLRLGFLHPRPQPILAREVGTWVVPTQIAHAESEKTGLTT